MKNYQKYNQIKHTFDRLNKAMNKQFWIEAIMIEYSFIDDRLSAVLAIQDINIFNGDKTSDIQWRLNELRIISDNYVKSKIDDKLISSIEYWKNQRNIVIHNMLNNTKVNDVFLECLAKEGEELVKQVNNKFGQVIKHFKVENENRKYYLLRKDSYIRDIGEYGYIVNTELYNDLVVDKSGSVFLKALSNKKPQSLDELSKKIAKSFKKTTANDIKNDVKEFFDMLVDDGYVVFGRNKSEAYLNNIGFSYDSISEVKLKEDYTPKNIRSDVSSQQKLDEYYRKNPYLSSFQIELTSKCNERCIHCYIPHEYKNAQITDELYYSVLKQLKEMGTLNITLSGGEPMAHPSFKQYLEDAKKEGFHVHVLSNLTLLTDDIVKVMSRGNKAAVQVSLYSMIPEHHDTITTLKGSFEKTKDSILKLIANDVPVQINCPVMKANKGDVYDVIMWGREHKLRVNVDYSIMAEYDHQTTNLANRLEPEECADVIKAILASDEEYANQMKDADISSFKRNMDDPFCGVGTNTCCMVSNGNVYPCPGWQSYICGNVNNKSLKEIWFDSKEINYLRNLKKRDMKGCSNCENIAFCSPCLSRFANESKTGNPLEIAPHFCKVAKVNKDVVTEWRKDWKEKQKDNKSI